MEGQPASLAQNLDDLREHARAAVSTETRTRRIVYSAAILYALLFIAAAAVVYFSYNGARLDMGNMAQAVWSTAHGHFLRVTTPAGREMLRLGAHVDPFLALLAPFWWVWPSPLLLYVVQIAAIAAGALPVYWLARKHLHSERAAAHFAVAYLLFPATQSNALNSAGPHPVSFAIPLLLFAIWFLDNDRLVPFAVLAFLAASTKEEIPAAVGCLGIWYALRKGHRLTGAVVFAFGMGAAAIDLLVIIPHYSPIGVSPFAGRYAAVGGTPGGMLHKLISDPLAFAGVVGTWHKLVFVALVFVPFLGLWMLEPLLLLGAIPDLMIDLLSSKPEQTTIDYQYTAGIIPFLVAASILGAAKLKRDPARVSLYALAGASCLALASPVLYAAQAVGQALPSNSVREAKAHAVHLVPDGARVSASNRLGGYLSARRFLYTFPHVGDAQWVVLESDDQPTANTSDYRRAVAKIDSSPRWKRVYASHGIQVLRRKPPPSQG